jgi:hypothetical protein
MEEGMNQNIRSSESLNKNAQIGGPTTSAKRKTATIHTQGLRCRFENSCAYDSRVTASAILCSGSFLSRSGFTETNIHRQFYEAGGKFSRRCGW